MDEKEIIERSIALLEESLGDVSPKDADILVAEVVGMLKTLTK